MSRTAPHNTAQIRFLRNLDVDDCRYQVTVASAEDTTDTIDIEVLGAGPGNEATQGTLRVSTTALPHLGPLLAEVLGGIAAAYGITVHTDPDAGGERRLRRRDRGAVAPPRSHDPWTPELEQDLVQRWHNADPSEPVAAVHARIGGEMGRSANAIQARLTKLGLDPDRPGCDAPGAGPGGVDQPAGIRGAS